MTCKRWRVGVQKNAVRYQYVAHVVFVLLHLGFPAQRRVHPLAVHPVRRLCPAALRSVRVLVTANARCSCDAPYLSVCVQFPCPSSASALRCPTTWVSCSCAPHLRFTAPLRSCTPAFAHSGGDSGLQHRVPAPRTPCMLPARDRACECSRTSPRMSSGPSQLHRRL